MYIYFSRGAQFSNFSMRSTCPSSILRQQYLQHKWCKDLVLRCNFLLGIIIVLCVNSVLYSVLYSILYSVKYSVLYQVLYSVCTQYCTLYCTQDCTVYLFRPRASRASPSWYSAWSSPRQASHLLPITLPQVKHLMGIIMLEVEYFLKCFMRLLLVRDIEISNSLLIT